MSTGKKELYDEVARFNKKYCKDTKNKLRVGSAYGGYRVELTGKQYANNPHRYRGIGSGCASVGCGGFLTPTQALNELYRAESKGYLRSTINHYEKTYKK